MILLQKDILQIFKAKCNKHIKLETVWWKHFSNGRLETEVISRQEFSVYWPIFYTFCLLKHSFAKTQFIIKPTRRMFDLCELKHTLGSWRVQSSVVCCEQMLPCDSDSHKAGRKVSSSVKAYASSSYSRVPPLTPEKAILVSVTGSTFCVKRTVLLIQVEQLKSQAPCSGVVNIQLFFQRIHRTSSIFNAFY